MSEASELIKVTYAEDRPLYNGYDTVHEALWNLEPEFRSLDFADRMLLSVDLLSDLEVPTFEGRTFYYTFTYDYGDLICYVYSDSNIEDPVLEWHGQDLLDKEIIINEYDVNGLYSYLVKMGELLPDDKLTLIHF